MESALSQYHKINTIYKRDPEDGYKTLLVGQYSKPEFGYLADNQWHFTEKVDGTNIRVILSPADRDGPYTITFGGKTDNAQLPAPLVARLEELFHNDNARKIIAENFPDGGVLYGEGYGGKIQKGSRYKQEQDFVLFDVKVGNWWLQRKDVDATATSLGLDVVPLLGIDVLHDMVRIVRGGLKSQWGDFIAEGIVARPAIDLHGRDGSRIITKLKHRDFFNG